MSKHTPAYTPAYNHGYEEGKTSKEVKPPKRYHNAKYQKDFALGYVEDIKNRL